MNDASQNTLIRKIRFDELAWVNAKYDEVQFTHSAFENEIIGVCEIDGERAGLGRLVSISSAQFELGGMYVFERFRKFGIATQIVNFLLGYTTSEQTIFCLPFVHLKSFYEKFGFRDCSLFSDLKIPNTIRKKHQWCNQVYPSNTLLLAKVELL